MIFGVCIFYGFWYSFVDRIVGVCKSLCKGVVFLMLGLDLGI